MGCPDYAILFVVRTVSSSGGATSHPVASAFPPRPSGVHQKSRFLREWSEEFSPSKLQELACAVCGCLNTVSDIRTCRRQDVNLSPLVRAGDGVTRMQRRSEADPVDMELPGPVLYLPSTFQEDGVDWMYVCVKCLPPLQKGNMPALSLANGRWVGEVPVELRNLTYGEELLISRYRRNCCVTHVKGGQGKLKANAVMFEQPVLKVYDVLPPPREDISECLAVLFTGPVKPSNDDYKRTPFIVRHRVVLAALAWLKLNNYLYRDVEISRSNMSQYVDNEPPVYIMYR
ncbi:hypothetical protein FKP32DRAFT_1558767, partial [Trametes sanguinea]